MDFHIARQPIFTSNLKVYAYELLYRGTFDTKIHTISGDRATASLLSSAFLIEGIEKISNFKPCFINFTKELLLKEIAFTLSPRQIVVEILEDVPPEPPVVAACKKLREQGYSLALDDFVYNRTLLPLIELADVIKIDIQHTPLDKIEKTLYHLSRFKTKLLAEKVESRAEFEAAMRLGFQYHQGFFFCRPEHLELKEINAVKMNMLQMLAELSQGAWHAEELAKIITRDVALTYKILRYINSSYFYRLQDVTSVSHSIAYLGEDELRRFALLAIISEIATDKPTELIRLAVIRARFCELLAEASPENRNHRELFILGLFSTLDAMLDLPFAEILQKIPLEKNLYDGLAYQSGPYGSYLRFVIAYERKNKDACLRALKTIGPVSGKIHELYVNALSYADSLTVV